MPLLTHTWYWFRYKDILVMSGSLQKSLTRYQVCKMQTISINISCLYCKLVVTGACTEDRKQKISNIIVHDALVIPELKETQHNLPVATICKSQQIINSFSLWIFYLISIQLLKWEPIILHFWQVFLPQKIDGCHRKQAKNCDFKYSYTLQYHCFTILKSSNLSIL